MSVFNKETFEGGSLPGSFDAVSVLWGSGSAVIDDTSKVVGTYSAKFGASGEVNSSARKDLGSNYSELYIQFKIFIPTAFAFGGGGYFTLFEIFDVSDNERFYVTLEDWGSIEMTLGGDMGGWVDSGLVLSKNAVHKIEIRVKQSATVGNVSIWVDNNVEGSPDYNSGNINTGTSLLRKLSLGISYSLEALTDFIYIDDVICDTAFIGEGVTKKVKVSDVFVDKPYKVKVGGSWVDAPETLIS